MGSRKQAPSYCRRENDSLLRHHAQREASRLYTMLSAYKYNRASSLVVQSVARAVRHDIFTTSLNA